MRSRPLAIGALLLFSACGDGGGGSPPPEGLARTTRGGGTVVIAYDLVIPTLGVLHTADAMAAQIQRDMLFMPLIKLDTVRAPVPWLAERWDTVRFAPDSLELTFHLREDVAWHDGVPTTAEDVRFTFDRIMDPRTGAIPRRRFSLYNPQVDVLGRRSVWLRTGARRSWLHPPQKPGAPRSLATMFGPRSAPAF
jgi:ABC-type transport system substrate-binding protein